MDNYFVLIGYSLTILSIISYTVSRFSKLETDVSHLREELNEFHDVKQIVYEIRAQNNILLQMKVIKQD